MRKLLLSSAAVLGVVGVVQPASALTLVSTIDGCYDCNGNYDTPALFFNNTTSGANAGTFINAQMVLAPYQPGTLNALVAPVTVTLTNMAPGTTTQYVWSGSTTPGNLTAYDYDDEWGNTPPGYTNPGCVVGGGLCSLVGNFKVTFTATILGGAFDGQSIFAVFSPTNNKTGGFLGWEGLDATGLSETVFDQHSGSTSTVNGGLADIFLGTPPTGTPLPAGLPLFAGGLGLLGFFGRRRKQKTRSV